jgi:hypothetical protein
MARNGSGTYSLPAGNPVTGGTTISSTWANNTLSDIGTALTGSLAKDGQTVPTNNLPMGGFKLTGLAAGSANGESVRFEQLPTLASLGAAASGTNTDITSLASPNINAATATTQAATDSSTKVATTAMVQSVGIHSAGYGAYAGTATLTAADIGRACYYASGTAGTLTLPTAPATGSIVSISNRATGICTVARGGTALISNQGVDSTSITLGNGESVVLVYDSANWQQLSSSGFSLGGPAQTWQNVTGSRVAGTTYTNSTGRPISVSLTTTGTATSILVNGSTVQSSGSGAGGTFGALIIVPNGATYGCGAGNTISTWWELR